MSDAPELLPCPFCGERLVEHTDHHGSYWAHRQEPGPCIMSVEQILDAKDAARWNTRADTARIAELEAENQRLRNQISALRCRVPDSQIPSGGGGGIGITEGRRK